MEFSSDKFNELKQLIISSRNELLQVINPQSKAIQELQEKLEKHTRINNIIVYGLEENEKENWVTREGHLLKLAEKLDLPKFDYDNCYRIGKKSTTQGHPRPLLVKLVRFREKMTILNARKKLKGTKIFISEDKTPDERRREAALRTQGLKIKSRNPDSKFWIKNMVLFVDNGVGTDRYGLDKDYNIIELQPNTRMDSQ